MRRNDFDVLIGAGSGRKSQFGPTIAHSHPHVFRSSTKSRLLWRYTENEWILPSHSEYAKSFSITIPCRRAITLSSGAVAFPRGES